MKVSPEQLSQLDLTVSDMRRSLLFYAEVLAWTEAACEIYNYHVLNVPEDCRFGIALIEDRKISFGLSSLCLGFTVASLPAAKSVLTQVSPYGGQLLGDRHLPGYGQLWEFCDPDGQRFRLFLKS